ncbi:MAG: TolC family protein [Candidatus Sumerlaeota bacterium]|nr:TolC family protein [Candidatus Sumerlaeota bacterium]
MRICNRNCRRAEAPHPLWLRVSVAMLAISASWLAGCSTYAPRAIRSNELLEEFFARAPDSKAAREFAASLAGQSEDISLDAGDGLTLAEAEMVALFYNPQLRAARLRARIPSLAAAKAGLWEDPELSADAMRILKSVDRPWILGTSLRFTIPISGRLKAEKQKAAAQSAVALQEAYLAEQEKLAELRREWIEWSAARQSLATLREFVNELERISAIAERLVKAGEFSAIEGRVFQLASARRRTDLMALEAATDESELRLKALMGLPPEKPARLAPQLIAVSTDALQITPSLIEERHPTLLLRRAEYETAERALLLEIRKQYPDLSIGPAYGYEDGDSQLGLALSLPLPILNANARGIAEAQAAREAARGAYEAELLSAVEIVAECQSRWKAAQSRLEFLKTKVAPLADRQMVEMRRLLDMGEINALLLMEELNTSYEVKTSFVEANKQAALAFVALGALAPRPEAIQRLTKEISQ